MKKINSAFNIPIVHLLLIFALTFAGVVTFIPGNTEAALDKPNAERLLKEFKKDCKIGSVGGTVDGKLDGKPSRCLAVANSLVNNVECKYLYNYTKNKIDRLNKDAIDDCTKRVAAMPEAEKQTEKPSSGTKTKEEICKNSSDKTACEKGFTGQQSGKSEAAACSGLSGSKLNVCKSSYQRTKNAADVPQKGKANITDISYADLPNASANDNKLDTFANVAFGIAGSLALLFVAIGGLRYIMSQGDPNNVSRAKNTILYALIGLVVTISAFAIVKFVLARIV